MIINSHGDASPSLILGLVNGSPALASPGQYPLQLGLAYIFLFGYLVRTVLLSVGLPSSIGVIFAGFLFSFFFQHELFSARDQLQELSFFLVLLTAGLEIRLGDLRTYTFAMAFLPATVEMLAIATYSVWFLNYSLMEGLVLGTILFALGDGLVIPKMKELGANFKGHPLPRLMFTWAPLEASYALCLFGILTGFAERTEGHISVVSQVTWNISRVVATVLAGAFLGSATGWIIPRLTLLKFNDKQLFSGTAVEAFLIVFSVALLASGLGSSDGTFIVIPMPAISGISASVFQPELLVVMTGIFFSAAASDQLLHEIERIMGGVWIFGQLILFSMIGSRTTTDIFPKLSQVLPLLIVGMLFRFIGIWVAIRMTIWLDLRGHPFDKSMLWADTTFCFLTVLPRATIQGALGQVPVTAHFFRNSYNDSAVQDFIFLAARLYICVMSVCGMILLNHFGPKLCAVTKDRKPWEEFAEDQKTVTGDGESHCVESAKGSSMSAEELHTALAEVYSVSPDFIADALQEAVRKAVQTKRHPAVHRAQTMPESGVRRFVRTVSVASDDMSFSQFDCLGSDLHRGAEEWRGQGRRTSK